MYVFRLTFAWSELLSLLFLLRISFLSRDRVSNPVVEEQDDLESEEQQSLLELRSFPGLFPWTLSREPKVFREGDCLLDHESSSSLLLLLREHAPKEDFLKIEGLQGSLREVDINADGAGGAGFLGAFREGVFNGGWLVGLGVVDRDKGVQFWSLCLPRENDTMPWEASNEMEELFSSRCEWRLDLGLWGRGDIEGFIVVAVLMVAFHNRSLSMIEKSVIEVKVTSAKKKR